MSIYSSKRPGSTKRLPRGSSVPTGTSPASGITAARPSAKTVTSLLACVAQDIRKPKDFDGGYGLQFNKPPEEDVVGKACQE